MFLEISQNSQKNTCARFSFLKNRLWHRCFPVNFAKFLRTPFLQNTSGQLLQTITSIALKLPTGQFINFNGALSGLTQLLTAGSPLKMMRNAFYFGLKALFVLKIFVLTFWSCRKTTWLERLISKFMTSQPGKQIIAIHMLPNISRSKGNQTTKFGQSMKYNLRNIYLQKWLN